jgi:chromosome partitioning protein
MKIALIANKGGVGKTTLCLLLHEAFRQAGRSVAVRDLDNIQHSATKALERFGGQRENPGHLYDFLLLDTPPSLASPATGSATALADVVLVPTSPSPVDIWEAEAAVQFAKRKKPQATVRVVLNRVKAGTLLSGAVHDSLEGTSAPTLATPIADRQSYQHLLLGGWGALDPKAVAEAFAFRDAVISVK